MTTVQQYMNQINELSSFYKKRGFTIEASLKTTFMPAVIVHVECEDLKVYCALGTHKITSDSNVHQFKQIPVILNKFQRIVKQLNLPEDTNYRLHTKPTDFQPMITFQVPTTSDKINVTIKFNPDTLSVYEIVCQADLYEYTSYCDIQMDKMSPTLAISANDNSDFDITLRNNVFFNKDNKYTTKSAVRFIQNFKHTLSQLIYYSN